MKKFSQLSEAKLEVDTNSVNYLTTNELKKYVNKMKDEFYSNVVIDYTDKIYVNTKQATLKIIDYLIKHNKTYVAELGGSNNKENVLAAFYQRSLSSDPEKKELYDAIFNGDVNAEKQWIKDYKDGKFKKRKDNVKGATKAALSMNLKTAITFIRANKIAVNMLKELYYEN